MSITPCQRSSTSQRIPLEMHDSAALKQAHDLLNSCSSFLEMGNLIIQSVRCNEQWRGNECINLLAPEAPTSPGVRALLASEIGTRAAKGNIGPDHRFFAGTRYIDEVESLCLELLKKVFNANYAEHRLSSGMIGNAVAYTALTQPGDVIMSISQAFGGHSSNRADGPAGVRNLKIIDIPFDAYELEIDLDAFKKIAKFVRPKLVSLGLSMTLFPYPVQQMAEIIDEWNGKIFFDGAHQLGLIAGKQYHDPLREGAALVTGSAGKTFSGPQSGIMFWNDENITEAVTHATFPTWAATHQINRVAALALSAAEILAFGERYMLQMVNNAKSLAAALHARGIPILGAHKGFTRTNQVIADLNQLGGGTLAAKLLERANIIANKDVIPQNSPEQINLASGLRIGTTEITRLGMKEKEMEIIADFIAEVLIKKISPEEVQSKVVDFRKSFQKIYYCFDNGYPT
jgi:glycine hydroxymethyltransferase